MRSDSIRRRLAGPALLLVLALQAGLIAACDDDEPFEPTVDNIAGRYEATVFTTTTGPVVVDLLAAGAFVDLTLNADGTTSGRVFVPGQGEDGGDFDEDLDGTWTLVAGEVVLDHNADTFLRDVTLVPARNRLTVTGTFDNTRVDLVLTRSR